MVLGVVVLYFFGFESLFLKKGLNLNARIHSKIVLKIYEKTFENSLIHPKLVRNPSKIDKKRSQIDENVSLECFRRLIAPRSAPRSKTRLFQIFS